MSCQAPGAALFSILLPRATRCCHLRSQPGPLVELWSRSFGGVPRQVAHGRSTSSYRRRRWTSHQQILFSIKFDPEAFDFNAVHWWCGAAPKSDPDARCLTRRGYRSASCSELPSRCKHAGSGEMLLSALHNTHAHPPSHRASRARLPPPTKVATPAERATEARLSPSHPPYPCALLSRSLALIAHTAVCALGTHLQAAARG